MRDVSVFHVWSIGWTVFAGWFAAAISIVNFLLLRISTRLSVGKSIVANVAISGLSWLFVAFIPIPLYAYAIGRDLLRVDGDDPISWVIPVVLSAVTSALLGIAVLVALKEKVRHSTFWLLFSMNLIGVGIAVWRMAAYVIAHPPEA
jgi:hypothetical protein